MNGDEYAVCLSLTRVTKSYLLALGTTKISSFFTKHWTKFLTHQTGKYPAPCVVVSCWETLAAMVACVEEACKIWIWLFRNVTGEGFEGSSVVRMARGKTCIRLPFCRREAVRAHQKMVTANLNSRDLMYRLGPAPKSVTRPIWPISVENRRQKSRCTFVYRPVAQSLGGIPTSRFCPFGIYVVLAALYPPTPWFSSFGHNLANSRFPTPNNHSAQQIIPVRSK